MRNVKLSQRYRSGVRDSMLTYEVKRWEETASLRPFCHQDLAADNALEDLTDDLRSSLSSSSSLVWVERLSDRTAPRVDIDALADRDDFVGAVMKRGVAALGDGEAEASIRDSLSSVLAQRRFSNVLEMPGDAELAEIVEAARWELAELFERGD